MPAIKLRLVKFRYGTWADECDTAAASSTARVPGVTMAASGMSLHDTLAKADTHYIRSRGPDQTIRASKKRNGDLHQCLTTKSAPKLLRSEYVVST